MKKLVLFLTSFALCFAIQPITKIIEDHSDLILLTPGIKNRKVLKLELDNQLQVYLVSDPEIKESSASLAVETGMFDDLPEHEGIAHFCEHMLFLGTEKYPEEKEYHTFIADHGGKHNAYTTLNHTAYGFSIKNEHFQEALDRFSQFFISPLFNESGLEREKNAVHNEFMGHIESDNYREWLIEKSLANVYHPIRKFDCGNLTTLKELTREKIVKWYEGHYSANKMRLCIYSPLPVEELKLLVEKCFSPITNKDQSPFHTNLPIYSESRMGKVLYLNPVNDIKTFSISWEMTKEFAQDQTKHVGRILSDLFNNGSSTSLDTQLKELHLIDSMSVAEQKAGRDNAIFSIEFRLTDKGCEQIDIILEKTFQAIKGLQKAHLPKYIFEDLQKKDLLSYQFQQRQDAFFQCMQDAKGILFESLDTYPRKSSVISEYDPAFFNAYVNKLAFENALFTFVAKPEITKQICDLKERFTQAEYSLAPIDQKYTKKIAKGEEKPFIFPKQNPYLPTQLEAIEEKEPNKGPLFPILIEDSHFGKIYYAKDDRFFIPKLSCQFIIKTPKACWSFAKQQALLSLLIDSVNKKLKETYHLAHSANIHCSLLPVNGGVQLSLSGINEHTDTLICELLQAMQSIKLTKEEFQVNKANHVREAKNCANLPPIQHAFIHFHKVFTEEYFLPSEAKAACESITFEDFERYSKSLFNQVFIEGIIYGQIPEKKAIEIKQKMLLTFKAKPYPQAQQKKIKTLLLPDNKGPFELQEKVSSSGNATLLVIQDGSEQLKESAMQTLLGKALDTPFFDELRTKQQTGYYVHAGVTQLHNQLFSIFLVQASKHNTQELLARFDLFLEEFVKNIETNIDKERFYAIKAATLDSLKEPEKTFNQVTHELFVFAFDYMGEFDRKIKSQAVLEALEYTDFIQYAKALLSKQNKKRVAFLIDGKEDIETLKYEPIRNAKGIQRLGQFTSFGQIEHLDLKEHE
jgi:insulysin